jgi:molybdopterin converting factor small subunit
VAGQLERVLAAVPALRPHLYSPEGALYPHVHIFINGRDARYLDHGLDAVIQPQDTVNIFPPVGGG